MAVRALAVVAFLLIGHDILMTGPAAAHGATLTGHHDPTSESSMAMGSPYVLTSAPMTDDDPLAHHPSPLPEDSGCGVIREASMPDTQSPAAPGLAQVGITCPPLGHAWVPASQPVKVNARAPTISPRTRQAMLQIFRV